MLTPLLPGDSSGVAATSRGISDGRVHGVLAGCRPPVPLPEYNACPIYPSTNKYTITCEHAVRVNVRANLLEVLAVDHVAENFTAVLTLHFLWIDPCLCGFKSEVTYMSLDGACIRRSATLVHRPGLDGHTDFGLKVDPHQDFAIGDPVEAVVAIHDQGQTIQPGTPGRISHVLHKDQALVVSWPIGNVDTSKEMKVGFGDVILVLADGGEMLGDLHFVRVQPSRFLGMQQPRWCEDPCLFQPAWSWLNAHEEPIKHVHTKQLQYVSELGGHVFEKFKFQGKFAAKLKLGWFPFDRQSLMVKLSSEQPLERQQFVLLNRMAGKDVTVPSEWKQSSEASLSEHTNLRFNLQQIRISSQLRRNPRFAVKHVVCCIFFLCCVSCLASLVPPTKVAERLAILLTVLLATAGYCHMISQWIPRSGSLTVLDIYVLIAFLLQFAVLLELLVTSSYCCEPIANKDDICLRAHNSTSSTYRCLTPPDQECLLEIAKLDAMFYDIIFGGWVVTHALFASCCVANLAWTKLNPPPHDGPGEEATHPYGVRCIGFNPPS